MGDAELPPPPEGSNPHGAGSKPPPGYTEGTDPSRAGWGSPSERNQVSAGRGRAPSGGQLGSLLRGAGIALFIAAAIAVFVDGQGVPFDGPEVGWIIGAAVGNLVLGLLVAMAVNYFILRARGERPSLKRTQWSGLNPSALVAGGAVAMVLALAFGARTNETAQAGSSALGCDQTNPVEFLPAGTPVEVIDREELGEFLSSEGTPSPMLESAIEESTHGYDLGDGPLSTLLLTFGADSEELHRNMLAGLSASYAQRDAAARRTRIGGAQVIEFRIPGTAGVAYYGRRGCHSVVLAGESSESTAWMTALLTGS